MYEENSKIPVSLLPEIYQDLAETVGLDAALALGREFGGMSLYLPKMETACRSWRDQNIRKEFTGANIAQLSRKYRLTSARVRQILGLSKAKIS
jgi:Mor family transcriptional regulator